jgi:hypothetical protein
MSLKRTSHLDVTDYEAMEIVTTSSENAFQSPLKSKRHLVQQKGPKTEGAAMVKNTTEDFVTLIIMSLINW